MNGVNSQQRVITGVNSQGVITSVNSQQGQL